MPNPKGHTPNLQPYQPQWISGRTKTIRVPIVLADQVIDYARKLDNHLTQVDNSDDIIYQVLAALEAITSAPGTARLPKKLKQQLEEEVIQKLQSLVTSE
ncbi:hypothetical protein [Merismopedia glauca]|uniref:Uncharacterized protein n=1 Tax=Merismopedia glauca CCAP 1448/3 TaxID=1296344 RepID=A0A2T1BWH8_9CYAN|nr:hypothetical protein [Merismopedia glauca]PSB00342.1 hypothetical protein C7B64_24045 [Merismopedia glauca CCAP 1448/3]